MRTKADNVATTIIVPYYLLFLVVGVLFCGLSAFLQYVRAAWLPILPDFLYLACGLGVLVGLASIALGSVVYYQAPASRRRLPLGWLMREGAEGLEVRAGFVAILVVLAFFGLLDALGYPHLALTKGIGVAWVRLVNFHAPTLVWNYGALGTIFMLGAVALTYLAPEVRVSFPYRKVEPEIPAGAPILFDVAERLPMQFPGDPVASVIGAVESWRPQGWLVWERQFQDSLNAHLSAEFPGVHLSKESGFDGLTRRADICIGNVIIEMKADLNRKDALDRLIREQLPIYTAAWKHRGPAIVLLTGETKDGYAEQIAGTLDVLSKEHGIELALIEKSGRGRPVHRRFPPVNSGANAPA